MKTSKVFVGIDVSKAELEVGVLPTEQFWSTPNHEAGHHDLVERLRGLNPTLIVLEATGGFETLVAATLATAGLPVVIDARLLALFAMRMRPPVRVLKDEQSRALDALFTRRRQIVDMLNVQKGQGLHTRRIELYA